MPQTRWSLLFIVERMRKWRANREQTKNGKEMVREWENEKMERERKWRERENGERMGEMERRGEMERERLIPSPCLLFLTIAFQESPATCDSLYQPSCSSDSSLLCIQYNLTISHRNKIFFSIWFGIACSCEASQGVSGPEAIFCEWEQGEGVMYPDWTLQCETIMQMVSYASS